MPDDFIRWGARRSSKLFGDSRAALLIRPSFLVRASRNRLSKARSRSRTTTLSVLQHPPLYWEIVIEAGSLRDFKVDARGPCDGVLLDNGYS